MSEPATAAAIVPRKARRPRSVLVTPEHVLILREEDLQLARHRTGVVRVDVKVHDDWHLAQRKQWKVKLAAAHPDRFHWRGSWARQQQRAKFLQLQQAFETWMAGEVEWYRQVQLAVPSWGGA